MIDVNLTGAIGSELRSRDFCVMRIELEEIHPTIWRTVILPKSANLGWVHAVIQIAMGWTNSHLHKFNLGDVIISDPSFELNEFEDDPPVTDEKTVTVEQVTKAKTPVLVYQYDFGDSWNHILTFEPLGKGHYPAERLAVCIGGGRACPPEDCGSAPGYEDLLEALRNKKHPEHRAVRQWLGRPYDPEAFSVTKANRFLAKLAWPKVSTPALGKVLGALYRAKT